MIIQSSVLSFTVTGGSITSIGLRAGRKILLTELDKLYKTAFYIMYPMYKYTTSKQLKKIIAYD